MHRLHSPLHDVGGNPRDGESRLAAVHQLYRFLQSGHSHHASESGFHLRSRDTKALWPRKYAAGNSGIGHHLGPEWHDQFPHIVGRYRRRCRQQPGVCRAIGQRPHPDCSFDSFVEPTEAHRDQRGGRFQWRHPQRSCSSGSPHFYYRTCHRADFRYRLRFQLASAS